MNNSFNQLAQTERDLKTKQRDIKAKQLRLGRAAMQLMSKTHPDMHKLLVETFGYKGGASFITDHSPTLEKTPLAAIANGESGKVNDLLVASRYGFCA